MLDHSTAAATHLFAQPFTATFLGDVLAHDYETYRHLLSVGTLCERVARTAGLDSDDALAVGQAGLFHDIGKTHVRASLLSAPCALTDAEWRIMRAHAARGEEMLRARGAARLASIVRWHHERLDGSGYPDGLRGLAIPWETRLLSVVDAYDALRANRPYASAVAHDEALYRLATAPHLFDVDAVAALTATLGAQHHEREADAPLS